MNADVRKMIRSRIGHIDADVTVGEVLGLLGDIEALEATLAKQSGGVDWAGVNADEVHCLRQEVEARDKSIAVLRKENGELRERIDDEALRAGHAEAGYVEANDRANGLEVELAKLKSSDQWVVTRPGLTKLQAEHAAKCHNMATHIKDWRAVPIAGEGASNDD